MQESRNIYQIARESAGLTQEKAAEYIDISVDSLRSYEGNRRIPPDKIVIKMIEIYNTQYLAYQHLKKSVVGSQYLPNIEIKELPMAVLKLQKEITDFIKLKDDMIMIASDGIIHDDEQQRWDLILKELDDISEAIICLKYSK